MASPTPCAPSLSRRSLRRYTSAIRTGCAKERSSGSVEGVVSNRDPYSDRQQTICLRNSRRISAEHLITLKNNPGLVESLRGQRRFVNEEVDSAHVAPHHFCLIVGINLKQ